MLVEKLCNVVDQRCLAGSAQDKIPGTDHRDFEFVLFEESFSIQAAAVSHQAAVKGRQWSSPKIEVLQLCIRFCCHGLRVQV